MMVGDRLFREINDNVWEPTRRIEEMDRAGVSMQVLSTVPVMFSYWAKPSDALDLSRRLNDHIAEVVRDHPTRFTGLGTIPMQDPDLAAAELERCVRQLGLRGTEIGTHVDANPNFGRVDTLNLDNAALQPVWSAAEELDAAIFVHPWDMLGSERMPKYWLPWLVAMPAETSLAICSMIFGGVFERFPTLRSRLRMAAARFHLPSAASITHFMCGLMWWLRKTRRVHVVISLTTACRRGFTSIHLSMMPTR